MIHEIIVKYAGENNFETVSPVFDIRKLDIPEQNKLSGLVGVRLATYFLVYSSPNKKKLNWIDMNSCQVESVSRHISIEGRISAQIIKE